MEENNKPVIGISCGDLNGIGMEVIMKTFADAQMLDFCVPVVFASSKVASYHRKALNMEDFSFHIINDIAQIQPKKANLLNIWRDPINIELGVESKETGLCALESLDAALEAYKNNQIDAIVTAPINKNTVAQNKANFTGHTGYIGEVVNAEPLMILASENLRVALVTGHIALADVSKAISVDLILKRLKQLAKSLLEDFGIRKPKIAVLSLNPHASDNGIMGNEEEKIISPAIKKANDTGILAFGPYPADGFFGAGTYKQFDGVLAMYHDQGLIAFKTIAFEEGVNYTAGLPLVRTSPDHGTGYDIAGKNVASEVSFREAVFMAVQIVKSRNDYAEMTANPLRISKRETER